MPAQSCYTYLTFDGNCLEAFEFYRNVFGGEFEMLSTFDEGPEDSTVTNEDGDRIMHVSLAIGSTVLMGSDSSDDVLVNQGDNFSLSVTMDSPEECDDLIERLASGGTITMQMQPQFWGAYFDMCVDQFGVNWMVLSEPSG